MKKGLIISAVFLMLAGIALLIWAFISSGFDFSKFSDAQYRTNTYSVSDDFRDIQISTKESDIVFAPSDDGSFRAVCEESDLVKHTVAVDGAVLKIGIDDQRSWTDRLNFFGKHFSVTLYLPKNAYESLTIESATGDVSVPEGFTFGSMDIVVSTGDVSLGASSDGSVSVRTSTGDITVRNVQAGEMSLSVSTGRIEADSVHVGETLSVHTGTGKTELRGVTCGTLSSDGGTGDITLRNTLASGSFRIERGTGDVLFEDCDAGEISVRTSTGTVTGTLLSEKIFFAESSTGKISVPKSMSGGRCEISTSTGRIEISISGN